MYTPLKELGINVTTTVSKVGKTPDKTNYANALLPTKLAEFNNIQDYGKDWKLETVPTYISVYSMERNRNLYPNPNFYRINLPVPIKNVCSVKLIRASIPKGEYAINEHNNNLVVIKSGITYAYALTIGDYDITTFVALLNTLFTPINIVASFNGLLSKMEYTCVDPVNITFDFSVPNSPYIEMGFNNDVVTWKNSKQSPNRLDLFGSQEIEIRLEELGPIRNVLECVFFTENMTLQNVEYTNQIVRYIDPHREFNTITVSFYNKRYDALYNFNGLENYLCICFESYRYVSPLLVPELSTS
jgi:hypothetical protein